MKTLLQILAFLAATLAPAVRATTAYGDLNNFDVINDTGGKCHGFEIELDDIRSTDITYTYDWNHYGAPRITEDLSDPAHPKVRVRYESTRAADGTFASFTNPQDPVNPIAPTDGHACTDPSVNLGCEHFGVGYYGAPSLVKYHWLVEDAVQPGTLVLGPTVNVATPSFVYVPPVPPPVLPGDPPAAPAQVQVVIRPPAPENENPELFGTPVWVKAFKTVQPSGRKVRLDELVTDDPLDPNDVDWAGDEAPETEIEWMIFQKRPANDPGDDELGGADDLPNGDETVTRRYEFYTYLGPVDAETGEAQCDNPDNCDGAVGPYIGAQMAGFNVESPLGLIDHLQDGELNTDYVPRTIVVGGNTPYTVTVRDGQLPDGLELDPVTGILSGTPTLAGTFAFTIDATDADEVVASKAYTLLIAAPLALLTEALPGATELSAYATVMAAEGGTLPYAWLATGLPVGLSIDSSGTIAGAPELGTAGSYDVSITVTDGQSRQVTRNYSLVVAPRPPVRGDIDGDGDVDRDDVALIMAGRNRPANGADDPRDLNHDGQITILDARIAAMLIPR